MKRIPEITVPLLILVAFLIPLRGGFTDDGFIHIQYAQNLIDRGEYSFNPGEVSFGTTSPLWVMELASLGSATGGGETLITISGVLSWICGLASVVVLYLLVIALGGRRWTAMLAAATFAADAWFARWTALGMETSTAVLVVLLMALASVHAYRSVRSAALLGVMIALGSLVRPEVYAAIPAYAVSLLLLRRHLDRRCPWFTLSVAAALLAPWLLFAELYIGSFLPNTAGAKSGGLVLDPVTFVRKLDPVVKIIGSSQAIPVLAAVAALLVKRSKSRLLSPPMRFILVWTVALPIAYVVFDIQVLSRYLLLVTPLLCVLGWSGVEELVGNRIEKRGGRLVTAAVAATAIAINATFYATVVVPPSRAFSYDLTHNMKKLALFLRDNSREDAVVAAADIGYLAFYSQRRVLDLGGLVEPATGELRSRHSYEDIIQRGLYLDLDEYPHVDFFIDRALEPDRFEDRVLSGYRFRRVYGTTVRNLGIRKPGPYYYNLYRLEREQ
ncbi:MAG: hypothetical protein PVF33_07515 [Candidatus Latescibacterota bacterium]|jgi:hypothetical protein